MPPFTGFPRDAMPFLAELRKHNEKSWFEANKKRYEASLLEPSKAFVTAMGERLATLSDEIHAEPLMNRSLFRIHRDTRFSADKSPYKTEVGIFFWEGGRDRMACPGYYVHMEPGECMMGVGWYLFPPKILPRYRDAVADPVRGAALRKAIRKVRTFAGPTSLEAKGCGGTIDHYKRVPAGFDPSHPSAELLKYKGLHAGMKGAFPPEFHKPSFVDWVFERFQGMDPLQRWLVENLG